MLWCSFWSHTNKLRLCVLVTRMYSWLTFAVGVYYQPSEQRDATHVTSDHVVDLGLANLRRLLRLFPGCTVVVYYGASVPAQLLRRLWRTRGVVLVFCADTEARAPMLGRLAELDVRRSEWTVTLDVHDDVRRQAAALEYIRRLPRCDDVDRPVRCATWRLSEATDGAYVQHMRTQWGGDEFVDAAGVMVHCSAPAVLIAPMCALGRPYQYGDDELVLLRWMAALGAHRVDRTAPHFVELDLRLSGVEILDKRASRNPEQYAHEVWTI